MIDTTNIVTLCEAGLYREAMAALQRQRQRVGHSTTGYGPTLTQDDAGLLFHFIALINTMHHCSLENDARTLKLLNLLRRAIDGDPEALLYRGG